jgi:nucleotide sugar dehydrogenase
VKLTISVVGLGKIGLALAAQYASREHRVLGCDINQALVELVNGGGVPQYSEPHLAELIAAAHAEGNLSATTNTSQAVSQCDVVVVIVPLVVNADGEPDFRSLDAATNSVSRGLRKGTLVIYETTLPVGTTRDRFGPMLEQSGLSVDTDFDLAFSPERVLVGRTFEDLRRYPKLVGGVSARSTERARGFYESVLDAEIIEMDDAETAEFVKLAETAYRDVNIALANELALYAAARGIDATSAFTAANTQPYSHLHQPGVGAGGHCIPVYPRFLLAQAGNQELRLVRDARLTNDGMAGEAVEMVSRAIGSLTGRRVLILGLAYRPGQKEARFSSALLIIDELRRRGARPQLHDPLFSAEELRMYGAEAVDLCQSVDTDAVIVQTDHAEYRHLDWTMFRGCRLVLDGRNCLDPQAVLAAGIAYVGVGLAYAAPPGD